MSSHFFCRARIPLSHLWIYRWKEFSVQTVRISKSWQGLCYNFHCSDFQEQWLGSFADRAGEHGRPLMTAGWSWWAQAGGQVPGMQGQVAGVTWCQDAKWLKQEDVKELWPWQTVRTKGREAFSSMEAPKPGVLAFSSMTGNGGEQQHPTLSKCLTAAWGTPQACGSSLCAFWHLPFREAGLPKSVHFLVCDYLLDILSPYFLIFPFLSVPVHSFLPLSIVFCFLPPFIHSHVSFPEILLLSLNHFLFFLLHLSPFKCMQRIKGVSSHLFQLDLARLTLPHEWECGLIRVKRESNGVTASWAA